MAHTRCVLPRPGSPKAKRLSARWTKRPAEVGIPRRPSPATGRRLSVARVFSPGSPSGRCSLDAAPVAPYLELDELPEVLRYGQPSLLADCATSSAPRGSSTASTTLQDHQCRGSRRSDALMPRPPSTAARRTRPDRSPERRSRHVRGLRRRTSSPDGVGRERLAAPQQHGGPPRRHFPSSRGQVQHAAGTRGRPCRSADPACIAS